MRLEEFWNSEIPPRLELGLGASGIACNVILVVSLCLDDPLYDYGPVSVITTFLFVIAWFGQLVVCLTGLILALVHNFHTTSWEKRANRMWTVGHILCWIAMLTPTNVLCLETVLILLFPVLEPH